MNEEQGNMTANQFWIKKDAVKEPPDGDGYYIAMRNESGWYEIYFDGKLWHKHEFSSPIYDVKSYLVKQSQPAAEGMGEAVKEALTKIANWELPATGKFWDDEKTRPTSYETEFGSNGARDYIRSIAQSALQSLPPSPGWIEIKEGGEMPEFMEGKHYSAPVWVMNEGRVELMSWSEIPGEGYCAWCNCYRDLDNEGEHDDQYNPTHWMPFNLPSPPSVK